jgi:hypothetical protein
MQTPLPVQLENWIKIVQNKKTPTDLKDVTKLHLRNIRAIIDDVLADSNKSKGKYFNRSSF